MTASSSSATSRTLSGPSSKGRVLGLPGLTDQLVALGVSYRFHGLLIREALQRKDDGGIIAHVIQVLAKLEEGVT